MIAKHVPMKSTRKSNFGELASYLSDTQDRNERVGEIRITNCHAEELADAMFEVMATQARNTRAEGDKTYHLIISFRSGENPPCETMAEIERRICIGLGFGEHQRVSATHHDTDNLHIHVAISKIHPIRLTMHEPFRAYGMLAKLCTALEAEHGLEPHNHQANKSGAQNRAADMEHTTGLESLLGWITRECFPAIQSAESWVELHQVMRVNGLTLRERGNGLVIGTDDGTMVKASSISRDLSKAKLQTRLGPFQSDANRLAQEMPIRQYRPLPMPSRIDTTELYARYTADQLGVSASRASEWEKARGRKNRAITAAKASGKLNRASIKLMGGSPLAKKALYALASKSLLDRIQQVNAQSLKDWQTLSSQHSRRSWNDWLQHKAKSGDKQALAALRARESAQSLEGDIVTGKRKTSDIPLTAPEHVTRTGTLIYSDGHTAIRDDGDRLKVSRGATPDGLKTALQMAIQRYGEVLTVNGSAEFKEQILQAVAVSRIDVRFDDPAIENRRKALLTLSRFGPQPTNRSRGVHR